MMRVEARGNDDQVGPEIVERRQHAAAHGVAEASLPVLGD